MGEARAVTLLQDCAARIAGLAQGVAESESEDYEYLAHHLSALGFFIADLQRGHADLDRLLGSDEPVAQEDETFEAPAVEEHRRIPRPHQPRPQPEPESFVAAEGEEAPKPGEVPAEEISPPSTAAPLQAPPSEQLLAASDSEIDAELLGIFIEEGHEVLDTIARNLDQSRANPPDSEALTTIRRGFHTLKGSGRMVGLHALGDAAWGLEQTLNRWLQMEWEPTAPLHQLIGDAQQLFGAWVAQLEAGGPLGMDAQALLEEAARLRDSDMPLCDAAPLQQRPRVATKGPRRHRIQISRPRASLVRRERARNRANARRDRRDRHRL